MSGVDVAPRFSTRLDDDYLKCALFYFTSEDDANAFAECHGSTSTQTTPEYVNGTGIWRVNVPYTKSDITTAPVESMKFSEQIKESIDIGRRMLAACKPKEVV